MRNGTVILNIRGSEEMEHSFVVMVKSNLRNLNWGYKYCKLSERLPLTCSSEIFPRSLLAERISLGEMEVSVSHS